MLKASRGITIVEYGLAAVLVLALCLIGFQTVGFGLGSVLKGLKAEMADSSQAAEQQAALALANRSNPANNPGDRPADGESGATVPSAEEFGRLIATLGANGATELLADRLTRQIEQWLQDGTLASTEASSLVQLANAGHRLADAQKLLEQARKTGQTKIVYDGKTYSTYDFATALRYNSSNGITLSDIFGSNPDKANAVIKPFALAYQQALRSSAMANPAVRQAVSKLSTEISIVTDALGWMATRKPYQEKLLNVNVFYPDLGANIQQKIAALPPGQSVLAEEARKLTRKNSQAICQIGSGQDQGTSCTIGNNADGG
jgi:Flp pilus assembly pilin Flp